jgi:hypothetical protein
MRRIIDVDKVQAALDRAARNALHGPRDVRAGRFLAADATARLAAGKERASKLRVSAPSPGRRKRRKASAG